MIAFTGHLDSLRRSGQSGEAQIDPAAEMSFTFTRCLGIE